MVWRIGWKIGQWEHTIGWSYVILKNRIGIRWSLTYVRLDLIDRIRLTISIVVQNALWVKKNKNHMRSVGQWERKIRWNLRKHESIQIMFVTLFIIGQWEAGLRQCTALRICSAKCHLCHFAQHIAPVCAWFLQDFFFHLRRNSKYLSCLIFLATREIFLSVCALQSYLLTSFVWSAFTSDCLRTLPCMILSYLLLCAGDLLKATCSRSKSLYLTILKHS